MTAQSNPSSVNRKPVVYLAGPYVARDKLREYADELSAVGFGIQCRWLNEQHDITPGICGPAADLDDDTVAGHARADLEDIANGSVLVAFTSASVTDGTGGLSGGRHVELGYALAVGHRVFLVGEPENVFHRLPTIDVSSNWHTALIKLAALLVEWERSLPQAVSA